MNSGTFWGILSMGFVFGYLLYYAVRHTTQFNIDLLSSAFGAIGGGVVIALFGKTDGWIAPYGIGIGAGFVFYLLLSLILIFAGKFKEVDEAKVLSAEHPTAMLLSQTLLGVPRQK